MNSCRRPWKKDFLIYLSKFLHKYFTTQGLCNPPSLYFPKLLAIHYPTDCLFPFGSFVLPPLAQVLACPLPYWLSSVQCQLNAYFSVYLPYYTCVWVIHMCDSYIHNLTVTTGTHFCIFIWSFQQHWNYILSDTQITYFWGFAPTKNFYTSLLGIQ